MLYVIWFRVTKSVIIKRKTRGKEITILTNFKLSPTIKLHQLTAFKFQESFKKEEKFAYLPFA